jgi:hypothetical protein
MKQPENEVVVDRFDDKWVVEVWDNDGCCFAHISTARTKDAAINRAQRRLATLAKRLERERG